MPIVTVRVKDRPGEKDYEIPASFTAQEVILRLSEPLGISKATLPRCRLSVQPKGRWMDPQETLEKVGVWDGALLILSI